MPARIAVPHAGEIEDDLDDDGARHEVTDLETQRGDGGDQGVAKHVAGDDHELRKAAAASGADVVLIEFLDHSRTNDTGHLAGQRERQGDGGHEHAREVAAGVGGEMRQRTEAGSRCM